MNNRTRKRVPALVVSLALAAATLAAPASASDLTAGDWKFRAQIYGWFPTVEGATAFPPPAPGGSTANVDASNYLDALRFVFMGGLEARKGRLGVITDYIYLDFDAEKGGRRDLNLTGPLGLIDIPVGASADVNLRLRGWAWGLAATYAAIETPRYELQVLGGLRYLKVDTTLDWRFTGNIAALPPAAVSGAATVKPDVWDAVVGVRGRARFGDKWFAPYHFDVGTGQSDLTWQAAAGMGYAFEWGELVATYRHLDYKFGSDTPMRDLSFSGPAVSLGFRW
jgi:hypothetical protein